MKNRIKRFFTTNIGWKIAAVFIGIIIWAVLSNTQDPLVSKDVYLPITYLNEDKLLANEKLCVLNKPETAHIVARVHTSQQSKVNASFFTCTADLVDHSGGDIASQRIHINVEQAKVKNSDLVIDWTYYRSDPNITVSMEEYIEKEFTVALKPDGSLSQDAQFEGPVEFTPSVITVSGPKSKFSNVNSVKATVDVSELNAKGPGVVTADDIVVKMYDANEEEIRNLDGALVMSQETVSLTATIIKKREVIVSLEGTSGTPATGFRVESAEVVSPKVVLVKGLKSNLSELGNITIPASMINIEGIYADKEFEIDLTQFLPEGVTIIEGGTTATVAVTIEAFVRQQFNYETSRIEILNTDELYLYSIEEDTIPVLVRGFREDLAMLNINESLRCYVDATGLEPGTQTVSIVTDPISGYILDNADSLVVTLNVRINEAMTTTPEPETETESESTDESDREGSETTESVENSSDHSGGEETSSDSTGETPSEDTTEATEPQELTETDTTVGSAEDTTSAEDNPEQEKQEQDQN